MKLQLLIALCLLNLYAEAHYHGHEHRERVHSNKHHNWKETSSENSQKDPPDHTKLVEMARYVMHVSDWASVATISVLPQISGFPFTNVKSLVDGTIANSTGIPYFYMSPLDFTAKDLKKNARSTVLLSLEESGYCEQQKYDAEDPRCTRLMLSGIMKKVKEGSEEYKFAKAALFERHPAMADFPPDHDWFVAKLKIAQIAMVDWFGGAQYINVKDYLNYQYPGNAALQHHFQPTVDTSNTHYKVSLV